MPETASTFGSEQILSDRLYLFKVVAFYNEKDKKSIGSSEKG